MDICKGDQSSCLMNAYKDFCYQEIDSNLDMTDVSTDDFITYWTGKVADQFDLDQNELLSPYSNNDKYNSNESVRSFWKYAAAKTVSGTPTVYINGVKLDNIPYSTRSWVSVLQGVYDSQYRPKSHAVLQ